MSVEIKADPDDPESIWMAFGMYEFGLYHGRSNRFVAYAFLKDVMISKTRFHGAGVAIKRFKEWVRQRRSESRLKEIEVDEDQITDHLATKFFHQLVLAGAPLRKIEEALQINRNAIKNEEPPILSDMETNFCQASRDFFEGFRNSVNAYELISHRKNIDSMFNKTRKIATERAEAKTKKVEE